MCTEHQLYADDIKNKCVCCEAVGSLARLFFVTYLIQKSVRINIMRLPNIEFKNTTDLYISVAMAFSDLNSCKFKGEIPDTYSSADVCNEYIHKHLTIDGQLKYKYNERPDVSQLIRTHKTSKMIIRTFAHCVYYDGIDYYSYYNIDEMPVLSVWFLR